MERLSAALLLAFGAVICAISLFLPPQGEIDSSVLMLFGQILIYAGSVCTTLEKVECFLP